MPFIGECGEVKKERPKEIIIRACYCFSFSKGNFSSAERPETPAGRVRGKERQRGCPGRPEDARPLGLGSDRLSPALWEMLHSSFLRTVMIQSHPQAQGAPTNM